MFIHLLIACKPPFEKVQYTGEIIEINTAENTFYVQKGHGKKEFKLDKDEISKYKVGQIVQIIYGNKSGHDVNDPSDFLIVEINIIE